MIVRGVGGGGLQPITQAILIDTFPPRQRGMSMAVFGMTVVAAPIIGPTLGGWITDNYSWRWIYGMMRQQAATMAFADVFLVLAIASAAILPFVWIMRRGHGPGNMPAH